MSFQIKDKDGNAIGINTLDKEAAEFWAVPIKDKYYAEPMKDGKSVGGNWFDNVGYAIHSPLTNHTSGWDNVRHTMWTNLMGWSYKDPEHVQIDHLKNNNEYLKPYFHLITFWEAKGYTPHQVKE